MSKPLTENPKNVFEFLVWAMQQKAGGFILLAAIGMLALWRVYSDWRDDMVLWRNAVSQMSISSEKTSSSLNTVAQEISANTKAVLKLSADAEAAHRTTTP